MSQVQKLFHQRRLIALVCLAVVCLTAMTPSTSGLLCAILVPLGPLFGIVVSIPAASAEQGDPQLFPFLETIGSRAPPAA